MNQERFYSTTHKESPLNAEDAWPIESFLVRHFEYGNYSFRQALRGLYHRDLKGLFYLAYENDRIIGAAGSLFSAEKPYAALLGPVCVESKYERRGVATDLCRALLESIKKNRIKKVYLGVVQNHTARKLYEKLGFSELTGVVMCKDLGELDSFTAENGRVLPKNMNWDNYADVSALMCSSSSTYYTFDYSQGIFSSCYEPMQQFLPVFPGIMRRIQQCGGCAKVIQLCCGKIVGYAQIFREKSTLQKHLAFLEFFIEKEYVHSAEMLLRQTIEDYKKTYRSDIVAWIPECDTYKKQILENMGSSKRANLPAQIVINQHQYAMELYLI